MMLNAYALNDNACLTPRGVTTSFCVHMIKYLKTQSIHYITISMCIKLQANLLSLGHISMIQDMSKANNDDPPKLRTLCMEVIKHMAFPLCKVCAIKKICVKLNIYPTSRHPLRLVKTTNERPCSNTTCRIEMAD
jgi:hypothetical protein